MPLSEEQRGVLVDDLKNNVDFFYDGYDPQVEVYRYGEGFSKQNPYVLVKFLPANKAKFKSIGDNLGIHSGRYHDFGFCHIEVVSINTYCQEMHYSEDNTIEVHGRLLCEYISLQCLDRVLKIWEELLKPWGASFDRADTIPAIRDVSAYEQETGTKFYNYDFDVYLRTQLRWNKAPVDYDESEDVAESAYIALDPQADQNLREYIRIGE